MTSKGYRKLSIEEKEPAEKGPFLQENTDKDSQNDKSKTKKFSRRYHILFGLFTVMMFGVGLTVGLVIRQKTDWLTGTSIKVSTGVERLKRADNKFAIEDVMGGKYSYSTYGLTWVSDDSYLHSEGSVLKYNMSSMATETIIDATDNYRHSYGDYELSPDQKWVLLSNNTKRLYRHSSYADYYIQDLRSNAERNSSKPRTIKLETPDKDKTEQIRYVGWAKKDNALVFVYKCNIYYVPTVLEITDRYYQLTDNGIPKKVFNGVPDWVYEEEIIASTHAIEVSKDGRYIAFVTFNATDVPFFKFPVYGSVDHQYTTIDKIAYPKAGYPNPTIKFSVIDMEEVLKSKSRESKRSHPKPPAKISKTDYYYAVMKWTPGNELFVQWMNRAQNETVCVTYPPDKDEGKTVEEHSTPHGWIDDDYVKPKFSPDGSYYITMLPIDDNRHLAKVSLTSETPSIDYLTRGKYWVQDINCYNSKDNLIYFRSTEQSPRYRQVYSIDVNTKEKKCLTCGLIKDPTTKQECTYHYPVFSKQCSWVSLMCQGPFLPTVQMFDVKNEKVYQMLASNDKSREQLKEKDLPVNVYYTIKSDGYDIPVKETRPPTFDVNKKYAVLFDVYGGPNTQKVLDMFSLHFNEYLCTNFDILVLQIDARGSGYYGYEFLHAVYKKLGYYEAIDAINVAKYLGE
ncbi:prolyl endopeptidase FAP-like, partial [Clytia hemisphaerica]